MKSREDVEQLKKNWKCDPLWDIERTEGFEEYYDELLAYRNEIYAERKKEWDAKLLQRSRELGIEGNLKLVDYIEYLKRRIELLEEMIVSLK